MLVGVGRLALSRPFQPLRKDKLIKPITLNKSLQVLCRFTDGIFNLKENSEYNEIHWYFKCVSFIFCRAHV